MYKVNEDGKCICKWCGHCLVTSVQNNSGICYLDIGEHVRLDEPSCSSYYYDSDLNRC